MTRFARSLLGRLLGGVLGLGIAAGALYLFLPDDATLLGTDAPDVGECLRMTGSSFNSDHEELACGDPGASYKIVGEDEACDETEINYTISIGSDRDSGNVADLCLALNASKGDCFTIGSASTAAAKVACGEGGKDPAVVKVTSVGRLGKDGEQCGRRAQPLENRTRKTLICLAPAA